MPVTFDPNVQALNAIGVQTQATAHNIANVNTEGFSPQRVDLQSGPQGYGVEVGSITQSSEAPLPAVPPEPRVEVVEIPSGTDTATEMVNLIRQENSFAANAQAIRAQDDMAGTVLDMMV